MTTLYKEQVLNPKKAVSFHISQINFRRKFFFKQQPLTLEKDKESILRALNSEASGLTRKDARLTVKSLFVAIDAIKGFA